MQCLWSKLKGLQNKVNVEEASFTSYITEEDSIDSHPEPETKVSQSVKVKRSDEDVLGDLPDLNVGSQKLTHLTASRPKVTNRAHKTRPTTRKSQLPGSNEAVDEGLDNFFVSKTEDSTLTPVVKVTPDNKKNVKTESNKTEPDSKKKHGLFGHGKNKDKEQKAGGLFGKFKKSGKPKEPSKSPSRKLSEVGEEVDGNIKEDSLSWKSSDDSLSQRSLQERSRSNQSVNSVEKKLTGSETDSASLKSQESDHSVNVSVNNSETLEQNAEEDKEDRTESGTEEGTTEEELDEEEESEEDKIEDKKPLELPKNKRSFDKGNEVKAEKVNDSVDTVENGTKSEEELDKEEIGKEDKTVENAGEDQENKTEEEEEEKKEEQPSPKLPAGVPKMMGGLPGLGGVNMMAELKAKQEKRKSMLPAGQKLPDKSPTASPEEKRSPFGAVNLKSVGDRKSKEKTENGAKDVETPMRPPSLKQNEDTKLERPRSSTEQPEKTASEKPARPAAPPKKPVPMRPKPPPVSNKPKPAPRRSLQSDPDEFAEEKEKIGDEIKTENKKNTADSSSPRTSVKDMIAELRNSGDKSDLLKQGRPPTKTDSAKGTADSKSKTDDKENDESVKRDSKSGSAKGTADSKAIADDKEKVEPVKRDSKSGSTKKAEVDVKPKPVDVKEDYSVKSAHSPEAGVIDHKTEENKEMTDSGIVYDSETLKLSVKDKISKFGSKEEVSSGRSSPKSSSLTRGVKPSDMKDAETPKRPRSMFAVLESNPGLKKQESDIKGDTTPKIKEEPKEEKKDPKEAGSPTEEVVMV